MRKQEVIKLTIWTTNVKIHFKIDLVLKFKNSFENTWLYSFLWAVVFFDIFDVGYLFLTVVLKSS